MSTDLYSGGGARPAADIAAAGPRLQVQDLRFCYPPAKPGAGPAWVLDGLSLSAGVGEWLSIMGASDSGKTTLCLLISGLAPGLTGGTQEGHVLVAGRDTATHPPPTLAAYVGLVFQDATAQLFGSTVEAELAWGLENLGAPEQQMQGKIDAILSRFGIQALRHRSPLTLSGGELKRVAIASVLVMEPAILILDEPMGGLDPDGRNQVLSALSELREEHSITILMTENDPEAVAPFATRLAVLSGGRLSIDDTTRAALLRSDLLTAAGVAIPQMVHLAAELSRHTGRQFDFVDIKEALTVLAPLLSCPSSTGDTAGPEPSHPAPQSLDAGAAWSVEIDGLWYWYGPQGTPALRGVDLRIRAGEVVAVVGANGSGKTTLAKHLNGLLRPKRGSVRILGREIGSRSIGEMAHHVGYLFQSPEQQIFSATVREEIAFGPTNLGLSRREVEHRVNGAMERFDLTSVAHLPPSVLGYGLRRRLTLASLDAMQSPILVLDEPTVGLDARGRADLVDWLRDQQSQGRSILLVTHDMELVAECAGRAVVLSGGHVLADESPRSVFDRVALLEAASLVAPPVVLLGQALRGRGLQRLCLTVPELCKQLGGHLGMSCQS
ncbi:MAG TPA: ABC transporter ATP-binding protein [Anaerolineae bacterium]|nr:ABC transporter ATP-binding protein [Anaerolineae bacterium]